jgi:hypothetical protein
MNFTLIHYFSFTARFHTLKHNNRSGLFSLHIPSQALVFKAQKSRGIQRRLFLWISKVLIIQTSLMCILLLEILNPAFFFTGV